jgi:Ni,Fe-hydrogenase I cytochrome b subunit
MMKKIKLIHFYAIFVLSIIICFCIYVYRAHDNYDSAILNLKRSKIDGKIENLIE